MITDLMFTAMRALVGLFFVISGFHKLFNEDRHQTLVATLRNCGIPFIGFCQWFVPSIELFAGLGVIFGFLTPLSALGLIAILSVAIITDAPKRVASYSPINFADTVDDYLYLPEVIFLIVLVFVAVHPNPISLDAWLWDFLWTLGGRHA